MPSMYKLPSEQWFTTRIKRRFLFFPKKIGNEIRWLTIATWCERLERFDSLDYPDYEWISAYWVDNC